MNTKHTPGNWKVLDSSIVAKDICICTIEDDGGYEAPTAERKANARLIAAAPKLLAACEAFIEQYGGYPPATSDGPLNAARAAIAKALGN